MDSLKLRHTQRWEKQAQLRQQEITRIQELQDQAFQAMLKLHRVEYDQQVERFEQEKKEFDLNQKNELKERERALRSQFNEARMKQELKEFQSKQAESRKAFSDDVQKRQDTELATIKAPQETKAKATRMNHYKELEAKKKSHHPFPRDIQTQQHTEQMTLLEEHLKQEDELIAKQHTNMTALYQKQHEARVQLLEKHQPHEKELLSQMHAQLKQLLQKSHLRQVDLAKQDKDLDEEFETKKTQLTNQHTEQMNELQKLIEEENQQLKTAQQNQLQQIKTDHENQIRALQEQQAKDQKILFHTQELELTTFLSQEQTRLGVTCPLPESTN